MYILDSNIFISLGMYYPSRFPTLWSKLNAMALTEEIQSVKEVFRELDRQCSSEEVQSWISANRKIFKIPTHEEMILVVDILLKPQYQAFVRKDSILKGLPVADPFLIAAAIIKKACLVTQESANKPSAARIPNACKEYGVQCTNLEGFLEKLEIVF